MPAFKQIREAMQANPYAVGMAAAKKKYGYEAGPVKDLPKKVIMKGHEIAKKIKANESFIDIMVEIHAEQLEEAKRLISTHGTGEHTAKVYKDAEYNEYQVHFFKGGKHMGEGPVSFHDDKADAQNTAEHETKRMNSKG